MAMVRLTLLFVALAYVPAIADQKTVGDITFKCEVSGGAKDGFDISVTNRGKAKTCTVYCEFTDKDGHTTKSDKYTNLVRANDSYPGFDSSQKAMPGAPLSNPKVNATCE